MLTKDNLHDYQRRATEFILDNPRCALWLGLGLGKTVTALTAITKFDGPTLVVAPLRVATNVWHAEAAKWEHTQHITFSHILGSPKKRTAALDAAADVYVINRENIPWLVDTCGSQWPFKNVVIDESSSFKSHRAKRFKALLKIINSVSRVVEMTATPAANALIDIWPQMRLLSEDALGKNITSFRSRYCSPDWSGYNWSVRPDMVEAVHNAARPFTLTMRQEDYLSLPDRIDRTVTVELPAKARTFYAELRRHCIAELQEREVVAPSAGVLAGKLQQAASGAIYDDQGGWQDLHDAKLAALTEMAEHAQSPMLVAYHYKHDLARIQKHLPQAKLLVDHIPLWNAGKVPIALVHPGSAGHGLNLQGGGHTLVWFSIPWSLESYEQTCGRLHRQGQEHPVTVHHLVAQGTIDEAIMLALERKSMTQGDLIDAVISNKYNKKG